MWLFFLFYRLPLTPVLEDSQNFEIRLIRPRVGPRVKCRIHGCPSADLSEGPPTPKCMRTFHVFVLSDIAWDWSRGSLTVVTAAHLSFPAGAQRQVWTCSQSRKVGLRAVVVTCCHQPNVDKNQVNLWGLGGERSVQCSASGVLALSWKTNRPWQLCLLLLLCTWCNQISSGVYPGLFHATERKSDQSACSRICFIFYTWCFLSKPGFDIFID